MNYAPLSSETSLTRRCQLSRKTAALRPPTTQPCKPLAWRLHVPVIG
jgi:hypothetical protein